MTTPRISPELASKLEGESEIKAWIKTHLDYPHRDWCLIWPFASGGGATPMSSPVTAVTDDMVTEAMRAFERMSSVLRYREKDKWHTCDIIGMRDAIRAALAVGSISQATQASPGTTEPRFFMDHGMIHDRMTGKHVTTDGQPPFEDSLEQILELLNSLMSPQRGNYEDRHPNDMVLHPLTEIREWDKALAVLGIQDSDQTPADAIRELNAEIELLRGVAQSATTLAAESEIERLRDALKFIGDWVAGPPSAFSMCALDVVFKKIRDKVQSSVSSTNHREERK